MVTNLWPTWIGLIVCGIIVIRVIAVYNNLIHLKNSVLNAYAGIDVQLKRRYDLIPNLVKIVSGYAGFEKSLLETIWELRSIVTRADNAWDIEKIATGDAQMAVSLKSLFAVAENYPDLKANKSYLKLQEELSKTEDQIAASRKIYNANVNDLNTKIQVFPSSIIASAFGFEQQPFFEAKEEEKENYSVTIA